MSGADDLAGRWSRRQALRFGVLLGAAAGLTRPLGASGQAAAGSNAVAVQEIPISTMPTRATSPGVSGRYVVWLEAQTPMAYDLQTGLRFTLPGSSEAIFIDGAQVAYLVASGAPPRFAVRLVTLASGARRDLPVAGDFVWLQGFARSRLLILTSGVKGGSTLSLLEATTGAAQTVASVPGYAALQGLLAGSFVAWRSSVSSVESPSAITLRDLAGGRQWTVAAGAPYGNMLALSPQGRLVWQQSKPSVQGGATIYYLRQPFQIFDPADGSQRTIGTSREFVEAEYGLAIDGSLLALPTPEELIGIDLDRDERFVICRAVGGRSNPAVSGGTVVWLDTRNNTLGKYSDNTDVYAATLAPGPAPLPPAFGVPDAVDARIEVVWSGIDDIAQATQANVLAYLFMRGAATPVPCQWNPTVRLWKAVDNAPAQPVAAASWKGGFNFPQWAFFDVDVAPARDPSRHIAFFVTVDGVPTRSSVWWHAAAPQAPGMPPQEPTGVGSGGAVDARIRIVWPRDGLPIARATAVNVTAALFQRGTLRSVPPEFAAAVTLSRSLDQGFLTPVLTGSKRLVTVNGVTYPLWDFNDIDVSAARDGRHTYYFAVGVAGQPPYTGIWAYGRDQRTLFPVPDQPGPASVVPG